MLKLHARTKLVILLLVPSILFSIFIASVSRDYLYDFFRSTQEDALKGLSEQIAHSLKGSIDQVNSLAAGIEQRIQSDPSPGSISNMLDILGRNRADYIRGMAYVDSSGAAVGYPGVYWSYFSEDEKSIVADNNRDNPAGVVYWSEHFYSLISTGNNCNPTSLVTKPVYRDKQLVGTIAIMVDMTSFLSATAILGGNYEIRTLLYDRDNSLADVMKMEQYLNKDSSLMLSEDELQNYDSALRYLKDRNYYYSSFSMPYHPGWTIVVVGNVQKLESKFHPLNNSMLLILAFSIAGLFFIYLLILWWFTRPLIQLSQGIRQVGSGDLDYRIMMNRSDEFGKVAGEFNRMSLMIKNLITELNAANEKKREADFKVLLSQVNPHFLYNTLNSIDMMVDVSPPGDVHRAMETLVGLLMYGLDKRTQLCPLRDELEYVRKYIGIQEIRYGNRFVYSIADPGELSELPVLKMILQPLAENAIFHGLHPLRGRKGFLKVEAWREDGVLHITVEDNGVGIPEDALGGLLDAANTNEDRQTTGIGLLNVHERIQLYYGAQYGLSVVSSPDNGTTVLVRIPAPLKDESA